MVHMLIRSILSLEALEVQYFNCTFIVLSSNVTFVNILKIVEHVLVMGSYYSAFAL